MKSRKRTINIMIRAMWYIISPSSRYNDIAAQRYCEENTTKMKFLCVLVGTIAGLVIMSCIVEVAIVLNDFWESLNPLEKEIVLDYFAICAFFYMIDDLTRDPLRSQFSFLLGFAHIRSPLEMFEITTFDCFGLELNETYAFALLSVLTAFLIANTVIGEPAIEEEDDEDFEDEDFTMDTADSLITDNIGDNDDEELDSIVQTIFQAVLFSNLANLIPFGDSNSNFLIFTIYLAGTCFLALNFNGFLIHTFNLIKLFLPHGVPLFLKPLLFVIEFISYFARLFSLGIRLFANMLSGHILMAILSTFAVILFIGLNFGSFAGLLLILIITCIFFLETIISYLQSYVFGMLVTIYYGDALNLHN